MRVALLLSWQAEDVAQGVDQLMKELDELTVEALAPGEIQVRKATRLIGKGESHHFGLNSLDAHH